MPAALTRAVAQALLLCGLGLAGAMALAQAPAELAGERQRLSDERAAVEARFKEQEAACQQRFAVTDCVNDAKKLRRNALAPLRSRGDALDDAQRKQRAAQQRENIGRKAETAVAREREVVVRGAAAAAKPEASAPSASAAATSSPAATAEAKPTQRAARQATLKGPPTPSRTRRPPERPSDAERRANEDAAHTRSAARKQAAQEHREATERRNAERAKRGKKVEPLPVPAGGMVP